MSRVFPRRTRERCVCSTTYTADDGVDSRSPHLDRRGHCIWLIRYPLSTWYPLGDDTRQVEPAVYNQNRG